MRNNLSFSHKVVSDSLGLHGLQYGRLPCPSLSPWVCSHSCPLSRWCHPTISSSVTLFSSCLQSFAASGSFPVSRLFESGGQVLELQLQHQPFQWIFRVDLVWFPCSPRDSQESPLTPKFRSTYSSTLSFLYGPTLTTIHDYWKNHSFN